MVSIPERIGTGSLAKFVSPTGVIIRGEINDLNSIIDSLRCKFTEEPFSNEVSEFLIHGETFQDLIRQNHHNILFHKLAKEENF